MEPVFSDKVTLFHEKRCGRVESRRDGIWIGGGATSNVCEVSFQKKPAQNVTSLASATRDKTKSAPQNRHPHPDMILSDYDLSSRRRRRRHRSLQRGAVSGVTIFEAIHCFETRQRGDSVADVTMTDAELARKEVLSKWTLTRHTWRLGRFTKILSSPLPLHCQEDGSTSLSINAQQRFFGLCCTRAVFQYVS